LKVGRPLRSQRRGVFRATACLEHCDPIAPFYRFVDPVSMPMLWRWARGKRVERIVVPLNHISPALQLAVIMAEDGSFCLPEEKVFGGVTTVGSTSVRFALPGGGTCRDPPQSGPAQRKDAERAQTCRTL